MSKIKTKSTVKDIRMLDKAADVTHRAKNAFVRTKEQAEQTQQTGRENYVEYAEDKITGGAQTVARKAEHAVEHQGKKAVQKIKERRTSDTDTSRSDTADGNARRASQNNSQDTASKKTASSKKGAVDNRQGVRPQEKQVAQQKAARSKNVVSTRRKYTTAHQNELAKKRFVQSRTKQMARSGSKAAKETAKGTIKTVNKSVKTAGHTAKTTIKTSRMAVKTAAKTAQATAKAAQRTVQAARMAAKAAVAAVKVAAKAIAITVKAVVAAVKGLIALIAAGGWVVIVVILVICLVGLLVSSPFGLFFSDENKDPEVTPISNVVQEVTAEFIARIEKIKTDHAYVDSVEINYAGSADNIMVDNWIDVVAVFAVKTAMDENGMDVATIDTTRIDIIKSVFWDMNDIDYYVETIEHTETITVENEDGTTSEETITTYEYILHITVTSETAEQQAEEYSFTEDQYSIMEEMLSGQFRPLMYVLLGLDGSTGLTPEQLQNLYNSLPVGELGAEIVRLALSRLGDPYSQPKAGQGNYTDCSYFARWCYQQVGISLPRTAAAQGKYCVDNGLTISPNDLVPGDLIFFSHDTNGRFMNITHVAIYAGNGMIVDASSSRGQVVYRELIGGHILYGRPHIQ